MTEERDVVRGYASAIFQIAQAEGSLDRVTDELFRFAKAVEQNHELRTALTDIAIPAERKEAVIDELLGERAAPHTRTIAGMLVAQNRGRQLGDIASALAELTAEARDKVLAEVRTAVEIDDATRQKLAEALSRATGKQVDIKVLVDPSVVGGVYAKVGDEVIDATIRRRLQELREQLIR